MTVFKASLAIAASLFLGLFSTTSTSAQSINNSVGRLRSSRNLQEEAGCETMATDVYFHIVNRQSKLLLPNSLGNNIFQWYTHDSWRLQDSGGGYYHVIGQDSGLALSIDGFGPASLIQEPSDFEIDREDWCFILLSDGFYQIKNKNSGLSLDATINWSQSSAAEPISQWWYYGGINQQWRVEYDEHHDIPAPDTPTPAIECTAFPPNTLYHIIGQQSNLALAVEAQSVDQGANVIQDVASSTVTASHWRMVATDSGYYQIHVQHSGMSLQLENKWDNNVVQDQASTSDIDDWCFLPTGDGYYSITNRLTRKALDVEDYSKAPGGNIHSWTNHFASNQLFSVETVDGTVAELATHAPIAAPPSTSTAIESWKGPFGTPVVAVAMANLRDGKILMWSAYDRDFFSFFAGVTMTAIFDPDSESFYEKVVSETQHDMFCPGTSTLADGRIMITGGADADKVTFYDPAANTWSIGPTMVVPRGYHTNTVLGDGSVFVLGGSWNGGPFHQDKAGEIWSPITNQWTLLTGVPMEPAFLTADIGGVYRSDNHLWLFTAPNGKVFHAGPSIQTHWIDTTGVGSFTESITRGTEDRMNGVAQIYDTGKIFVTGGAANYDWGLGTKEAYIIDINNDIATVKRVGDMAYARTLCNAAVLPSGETVVIGGQYDTELFSNNFAVFAAEIFDPVTETFTTIGSMRVERNYHSTAILMKDGRVLAAGGGLCGGCSGNHRDMEFLTPPYLLDASGSLAERSTIKSYTPSALPGETITVTMDRNQVHTFALVRTSVVTHSVNTDQRRIPLPASQSGAMFTMTLPKNPNVSMAGIYYLFAMDAAGVPSVAVDFKVLL